MVSHKNVYNSLSLDMKKRFEARKCVFILAESVEPERLIGSGKWAEPVPYVNLTVVRPLLARAPLTARLNSRAT